MARKVNKEDIGTMLIGIGVGVAAEVITHKALTSAWTRVTGQEPPTNLESPEVSLEDALSWAVLTGVGVQVVKVLAVRAAHQRLRNR